MQATFLAATPAQIVARLQAVAAAVAGAPVVVRVSDEVFGCRNVGVDLPPGRRAAGAGRLLRDRVRSALEAAGVVLAETAVAPRVGGDVTGNVRVREVAASWGDASQLARPARQG
jgi:hypothetical protein